VLDRHAAEARPISTETVATIRHVTKAELIEQVKAMTEEEAAEVKLIYAPDWPSKATSIEEIRKRTGTRAMTPEESEEFWREHGPLMQPPDGEG
jgi:lipopolysaccharide biosynthesis protein